MMKQRKYLNQEKCLNVIHDKSDMGSGKIPRLGALRDLEANRYSWVARDVIIS